MLQDSEEKGAPKFEFRPAITDADPEELLVQGGLIRVRGSGLNTSFLPGSRVINGSAGGVLGAAPAQGGYSGIGFDLFGNRSLVVSSFDVSIGGAGGGGGRGRVWVMARRRSSCEAGSAECGQDGWTGAGLNLQFWEYVGDGGQAGMPVSSNGGLISVSLLDPDASGGGYRIEAGERRGFAVISTGGVSVGNSSTDACPGGVGEECAVFADEFLMIEPGVHLSGASSPPGSGQGWQHVSSGSRASPAFFAGAIEVIPIPKSQTWI
jgi:hypothetical protein